MTLSGCTIGSLVLSHATLRDVDLRGARIETVEGVAGMSGSWISGDQLVALAPALVPRPPSLVTFRRRPGAHLAAFSSIEIQPGIPPSSAWRCTHLNAAKRNATSKTRH